MLKASGRPRFFARIAMLAGVDFHVAATLAYRGWSVVAGGITVLLLPAGLTAVEQGYYYTFGAVLALQIFFELGLGQVVIQLVSHEAAHLQWQGAERLVGSDQPLGRLRTIVAIVRVWYRVAALMFVLVGGAYGLVFFGEKGTLPLAHWVGVWAVLVVSTGFNLCFSPLLATFEGCGLVGNVAKLRFVQSLAGYSLLWLGLLVGFGLWATASIPTVAALMTAEWLRRRGGMLRWLKSVSAEADGVRWRSDIFPLQWRMALSFICGYFMVNLLTPLAFSRFGAAEAGRLGLALTIYSSVLTVGMSWINANIPELCRYLSRGQRKEFNTLFWSIATRSFIATSTLAFAILAGAWSISTAGWALAGRIPPLPVLGCLALVTITNAITFAGASYMRAHREEPMLPVSIATAIAITAGVTIGSRYGIFEMVAAYAAAVCTVALPWTAILFVKYQRRSE